MGGEAKHFQLNKRSCRFLRVTQLKTEKSEQLSGCGADGHAIGVAESGFEAESLGGKQKSQSPGLA